MTYKLDIFHLSPHGFKWFREELEVSEENFGIQIDIYERKWRDLKRSLESKWEREGKYDDKLYMDCNNINIPSPLYKKIYKEIVSKDVI